MPRDIPVGNGDMLVTFDSAYHVRDIYYPHVGRYNHTSGYIQRFGVWADGRLSWVDDGSWKRAIRYKPETLVTDVLLVNDELGLELRCHDAVDFHEPVLVRKVIVRDLSGRKRDVRLFFHVDLSISESQLGDTAAYDPRSAGLLMYKGKFYFMLNGCDPTKCGIDCWSIGTKRLGSAEGTWRDAEDGDLGRNAIAQGSVDATIGFFLPIEANGTGYVATWLACGDSYDKVNRLSRNVFERGPDTYLDRTEAYWRLWVRKVPVDTVDLPKEVSELFYRSQLILRTQIDNRGAIIAANDTDITHFAGDHYSYCWPRDGALVAYSLIQTGQSELSRSFFRFAGETITRDGYFFHKYTPEGRMASSWHPWTIDGEQVLPIQQDETALVVWALRKHFEAFRDVEFIKPLYAPLVVHAAAWMLSYRDANGLPRPSWDLWEERRGIHTFTVAATIGALRAAAAFATDFGDTRHAADFQEGASRMLTALKRHLWSEEKSRFARMAKVRPDGSYELDLTRDAANYALFAFDALDPRDPMLEQDMASVFGRLTVGTPVGGVARYENDYYHQVEKTDIERVPGNPWIICSLWKAMHIIARAQSPAELTPALDILKWTAQRALPSGVLAEQLDPHSGAPVSVSPLTWSHAAVVTTVMDYLHKAAALRGQTHAPALQNAPVFF